MKRSSLPWWVAALILSAAIANPSFLHAQKNGSTTEVADGFFEAMDWPKAASAYGEVINKEPDNMAAIFRQAYALHAMGKYNEAIEGYLKLNAKGGGPVVSYNLACAYSLTGEKAKAFEWLEKAAEAGFSDPELLASDTDLKAIRGESKFTTIAAKVETNAHPCTSSPSYHAFDFWIGQWDVHDKGGEMVGTNNVESILGQCALMENWSGRAKGTGKSINVFNKVKEKWQQLWVDDRGEVTEFVDGTYKDGTMTFTSTKYKGETKILLRLSFYNLGPDKVRQFAEYSMDEGKNWSTNYDFLYTRHNNESASQLTVPK